MTRPPIKAVALLSGGLDSQLSIKIMQEQGIEVIALHFSTPFNDPVEEIIAVRQLTKRLGVELAIIPKTEEFFDIIKHPRFGYGKNLNPCMDCRLWIIQKAWTYAQQVGAEFIITGEVVGQRPKSQHLDQILVVDRASGIPGRILRPLSAKLLPISIPEEKKWVDRDKLLDIQGRSRARQVELGRKYHLVEEYYATGGCPLCEHAYAVKMRDYLDHTSSVSLREIWLLKIGRHFRYGDTKIIVGRHKDDNEKLEKLAGPDDLRFEVQGVGSPITLLQGPATDDAIQFAASLTARYSDAKGAVVEVNSNTGKSSTKISVKSADPATLEKYRIF
jgi:tRNA-specific 2-thiouridylase